ncbi:hypothetical protein TIFTF001_022193 [Ficus carica]|uniref:Uncharacterized protein n=1 Tax=Ficus carica TaxID=3494 RepID=A0AA88AIV4_FICCA|nr:hypothetical protein TIFTF001_022193 [Ficus carica]
MRNAIESDLGRVWVLSVWRGLVVVEEGGPSRWLLGSTVGQVIWVVCNGVRGGDGGCGLLGSRGMKKMVVLNPKEEKLRRRKSANVDY